MDDLSNALDEVIYEMGRHERPIGLVGRLHGQTAIVLRGDKENVVVTLSPDVASEVSAALLMTLDVGRL